MTYLEFIMREKMTSQDICMFKTLNIWRTRQAIEKLKMPCSFTLILYLIEIKTR